MKKTLLAAALVVAATAGSALAGGSPGSIGVGAEYLIGGGRLAGAGTAGTFASGIAGGPSINYDTGAFHVGGFLAIADGGGNNDTDFGIGGRFFYHVASSATADFSVGGSLGYLSIDTHSPAGGNRTTAILLEPGVQIRAFVATNVALSATAGLTVYAADADGLALTGQTVTGGIHYYFF